MIKVANKVEDGEVIFDAEEPPARGGVEAELGQVVPKLLARMQNSWSSTAPGHTTEISLGCTVQAHWAVICWAMEGASHPPVLLPWSQSSRA